MNNTDEKVLVRVHGSPALPTLIYLPGMHGDWTLVASFRAALEGKVRFAEITYPRTTTWSLDDYAREIEQALLAQGVNEGWLVGESFGSQPAWAMVRRIQRLDSSLKILGLVLAGGFVKHPWPWGAKLLRLLSRMAPGFVKRTLIGVYAFYARFRHRQAPETRAEIKSFVANRLHPDDSPAMQRRYALILDDDLRPVASECTFPVYQLAGFVDPIVPAPVVGKWLRRFCPGFRASKIIYRADHNVLATAPRKSSALILNWMAEARSKSDGND